MGKGSQPLDLFDRAVVPVLSTFAAVVLFAMMALTCADVVARYFFNLPIFGAFEITEMLLAALIFGGLPLVTLRNEHVTVDLLDPITPDWAFRLQHVVACAIGFMSTGYLAWRLWVRAMNLHSAGETTAQRSPSRATGVSQPASQPASKQAATSRSAGRPTKSIGWLSGGASAGSESMLIIQKYMPPRFRSRTT